jgi:hypothetical protein
MSRNFVRYTFISEEYPLSTKFQISITKDRILNQNIIKLLEVGSLTMASQESQKSERKVILRHIQ